jgi:MFS family permease
MMAIFRNRNFSLIWFAGLISIMGNWIIMVALPYHIYKVTGSALATSAWLMAYILPGVLFSSVAGVFVDRWDRKKTMVFTNFLQMLVILNPTSRARQCCRDSRRTDTCAGRRRSSAR